MPELSPLSLRYKVDAEKLVKSQKWENALDKYAQALRGAPPGPETASIHQARAECFLKLQSYDEAVEEARRATEMDPSSAQAWGTLGSAYSSLEQWITCFEAYDRAIALASKSDPKLLRKLQREYAAAKQDGESIRARGKKNLLNMQADAGEQPWGKAKDIKVKDKQETSSWVILEAHDEYRQGVEFLSELRAVAVMKEDDLGLTGNSQAITFMTNGIVRDERCFYMDRSPGEFMKVFSNQAQFEVMSRRAWDLSAEAETVIGDARMRQRSQGWSEVRPAIGTTIRVWLFNAHLAGGLQNFGQSIGLYRRVLQILDWGRKEWAKITRRDRGTIFDSTFVRACRVLYGNTLVRAVELDNQTPGKKNSPYSLQEVIQVAEHIIRDCKDRPAKKVLANGSPVHPGFLMAFQKYPEGKARMMKGFYYMQMGRKNFREGNKPDGRRDFRLSANEYMNASAFFPADDEYRSICILNSIEALFQAGTPLRETSGVITTLRSAWETSSTIWGGSSFAKSGGKERVELIFKFQENALQAVKDKKAAFDDHIVPGRLGDRVL